MSTEELAAEIKGLKEAYMLYSESMPLPYVECEEENYYDQAYLYANKEDADLAVSEYGKQGIRVKVMELKPREVVVKNAQGQQKKQYLNQVAGQISILPLIGVNALAYRPSGGELVTVGLDQILAADYEKKLQADPMCQPNLQLTGIYLKQAACKKEPPADKKLLLELDEEFSANLARAKMFLGVLPPEGHEKDQKLDLKACRMLMLQRKPDGEQYLPVFSDRWEFQKYAQQLQRSQNAPKAIRMIAVPFQHLEKIMPEGAKDCVLNPFGFSLRMPKELIEKVTKRFGTE